jgi:uncharacterized membrane protein
LFALIALQPVLNLPGWVIPLSPIAVLVPLIVVIVRKLSEPADQVDATPNECWRGGIFYYNPNDAAMFVEKREGFGYTFNFANPWSWVLLLGLMFVVASTRFVLA